MSSSKNTNIQVDNTELQKKESSYIKELREIRAIEHGNQLRRKQIFIEWADILERMIEAGIITIKKKGIASRMAASIKTHGGTDDEIRYMYDCLPFDYKTSQEVEAVSSQEAHEKHLKGIYVCHESKAIRNQVFDAVKLLKTFGREHLTKQDHQDLASLCHELSYIQDTACSDRHYVTIDTTSADQSWQDELPKQFAEKYSINKPKPKKGYLYQALIDLRDVIESCAIKVEEYSGELYDEETGKLIRPAMSEEDDKRFARGIYALCTLFAPYLDDKWRRDWFQWHKIVKDRLEFSLHGAMSKSKLPTIMASALRGVTREQIDAKVPVVYKFWKDFAENIPGLYAMHEFYIKYQQPFLGDLTLRMREKMSFLS